MKLGNLDLINHMDYLHKRTNPFDRNQNTEKKEDVSEAAKKGDFSKFPITDRTIETLKSHGFEYLFPIQQATYSDIFEGSDLIGRDRTGSGKTLAFALPVLERLRNRDKYFLEKRGQKPLILVLVPTRELAMQVTKEFEKLKNTPSEYRVLSVYGGTDINEQIFKLRAGVEVIVGTPGRVMDLQERKELILSDLTVVVLDETDQMLNFGFQEDIEKILHGVKEDIAEKDRKMDDIQFLLFSATIPRWVEKIAYKFMKRDLVRVDMVKDSIIKTSVTVEHLCISFPNKDQKIASIGDVVMVHGGAHCRTIIFTDTKEEANDIMLNGQLKIDMQVLHGDIPQNQREVTFKSFRSGKLKCLVATNVAARGLDIPEVDLIIQLSPPKEIDTYIHRSGRTGRAGKSGVCITFYSKLQKEFIDKIEFKAGIKIKKVGIPQPEDIIRASARDISHSFDNVSEKVLACFEESVDDILEHYSPKEALCRALAIISGYTKSMKQRSLLFSTEGFITYIIESDQEVRSLSYFYNFIRNSFAPHVADSIKGMRFLAGKKGAIFDLDEKFKDQFEDTIESLNHKYIKIYAAKELPEIEDRELNNNFSNSNGDRRNFNSERRDFNDRGKPAYGEFKKYEFTNSKRNNYDNDKKKDYNDDRQRNYNDDRRNDYNDDRRKDYNEAPKPSHNNFAIGAPKGDAVDETKLFIANLGEQIDENDIRDYLGQKGITSEEISLTRNPEGISKGFGYVRFGDSKNAKSALDELSSSRIKGRQLRVSFAMKKKL